MNATATTASAAEDGMLSKLCLLRRLFVNRRSYFSEKLCRDLERRRQDHEDVVNER
jgi:hypothetical protein